MGVRLGLGRLAALWVMGGLLFGVSMGWPFLFVFDDALFYLVIGRNIVAGRGLTFSRVMPTNGFQPLWQGIEVVIVSLCERLGVTSASGQLRVVMIVCWALLAVGMALVDKLLRELGAEPSGRFVALLGILAFLGGPGFTLATEASLVLVMAGAVLVSARRLTAGSGRPLLSAGVTGVLVGLLMLARLDTVFLAVVIVIAIGAIGSQRPLTTRLGLAATTGAVAAVVVLPYLAWNVAQFGRAMPIAGAIKVDTSQFGFSVHAVGYQALVLLGIAATGAVVAFRGQPHGQAWSWWLVTFLGAGMASAFYFLFAAIAWTGAAWYDVPHLLAAALAIAPAFDRLSASPTRLMRAAVVGGVACLVALTAWLEARNLTAISFRRETEASVRFGYDMREVIAPDEVVAVLDRPGVLALTSDRPLVAFDGLTGDFTYQDHLRDWGPSCTFASLDVRYVVTLDGNALDRLTGTPTSYVTHAGSMLYDAGWEQLVFEAEDQVLAEPAGGLRLFRYEPECPNQ